MLNKNKVLLVLFAIAILLSYGFAETLTTQTDTAPLNRESELKQIYDQYNQGGRRF